ncbi:MAG: transcription-repair coupling factor [Rhodothermia bacterium]|nr:MAG: transcription-repair coupling factor [Rhodothermia bacterium]
MSIQDFYTAFSEYKEVDEFCRRLHSDSDSFSVKGLSGSLPAFLLARVNETSKRPLLCLTEDEESAAYLHSDIQQIFRREENVFLFPASDLRLLDPEHVIDPGPSIIRTDILQHLDAEFAGVIVSSVNAFVEYLPSRDQLEKESTDLATGTTQPPEDLIERLVDQGFSRVEFVEQPGDLALRGGILDVFPFTGNYPIRIEFFGDEIDSIREFDIHTQLSVSRKKSARLIPNVYGSSESLNSSTTLLNYLPSDLMLAVFDDARLEECVLDVTAKLEEAAERSDLGPTTIDARKIFLDLRSYQHLLESRPRIRMGTYQLDVKDEEFRFDSSPQPTFNSSLSILRDRLTNNHRSGIRTSILCDTSGQESRIHQLLEDDLERFQVTIKRDSLHEGFEMPSLGFALYTDHQIFNRYHRPTARKQKHRFGGISLRELHHLLPGDFVVHIDYGIGKFAGLQQIDVRGKRQEVVRLEYNGRDVLYVNVNALYKLHKYKGKEGHQPKLTKLGSGQWERTKSRTKSRVKDIARDLIKLYASRKKADGFEFSEDTVWQQELEASFVFDDTPDQASASEAVKEDMINPVPMDRLVCGDVGFGKTEIAIRAAFKSVQDGKQVAVLVPTTVLAMQHFRTFSERLNAYPVQIHLLSRFRSPAQIKSSIEQISGGTADVVIGTHRMLSEDVKFKDLGLLILDEEQRFGVAVKEKLRQLRVNVDTLTLTATPIPRTLQFSLLGARDLSIIATPPPNRQPIETEIHTFDKDLIRDAILYEIGRNGQVFFIHNRVQSIDDMADTLRMLIPDVRFRIAHGQMKGSELEKVMMGFINRDFDVLVSTNIIENGLDISNANTIIMNRADQFGLAELHQLRGRVGRSDRKAFCFLLVPSIHGLTREARQRLQAVEELSDLGSGFQIAMRDLDIRGAGNLLGAEQTGFIEDIGFETYHRILDEAVQELRADEFSDLFDAEAEPKPVETTIEVEADAFIPESYLSNRLERLNLYRRISESSQSGDISAVRTEMEDRFGPIPDEVENLLLSVEIKALGKKNRLARVLFKNERLFLIFPDNEKDPYFYEKYFHELLRLLGELDRRYALKENSSGKLRAIVQEVPDLRTVRDILTALLVRISEKETA